MKKFIILLTIIMMKGLSFAGTITLNQTFTSDTSFNPFPNNSPIYGLTISGNVVLNQSTSLIRVLLQTNGGNEYMIFESYPLIAENLSFTFNAQSDETTILNGEKPVGIRIELIDARIMITQLVFSTVPISNPITLQLVEKKISDNRKINTMKQNLPKYGMSWIPGYTKTVSKFYFEKKAYFGVKYNLLGFDYYNVGVFRIMGANYTYNPSTSAYVSTWDWRTRHNANSAGPYFDGDDSTHSGWISSVKAQGFCNSCACFATIGMIEANANLYFNKHIEYNLSEQQLVSCTLPYICQNGVPSTAVLMDFCKNTGIVTETRFPYLEANGSCVPDPITNADTVIKINSWSHINNGGTGNWDAIKQLLITKGPVSLILPWYSHQVVAVGYVYDELTGAFKFIIKDSMGTNFSIGNEGFAILEMPQNNVFCDYLTSPVITQDNNQPNIVCKDVDGDGYYNWGIGPKPVNCNCPPQEDCDDSNPNIGPFGTDYSCGCLVTYLPDTLFTNTTTWSTNQTIRRPIVVNAGITLTITDTVYFQKNALIVVKPGGKLIINGGFLTRACNDNWKGVQVWGNKSITQFPIFAQQGYVQLINGGCISYAETGLYIGKKINNDDYPAYSGGAVQATNAKFLNNIVDVEFRPYLLTNRSYFNNTLFETKDTRYTMLVPNAHVILRNTNGIGFRGCDFIFEEKGTAPISMENRGTGILSFDAVVSVIAPCSGNSVPCYNFDSCTFQNLRYGIRAYNTGTSAYFQVDKARFISNCTGIYMSGFTNSSITSSDFKNNFDFHDTTYAGNIYLEGCTGYHIENNKFHSSVDIGYVPSNTMNQIGVYVKNSGSADNEIYNNKFNNLDFGIIAEGVNKGTLTGLCLKCNDFTANFNDMMVIPIGGKSKSSGQGIRSIQGVDSTDTRFLAGNTFSNFYGMKGSFYSGKPYNWNYFNSADNFTYVHHKQQLTPVITYPADSNYTRATISLIPKQSITFIKQLACPSKLSQDPQTKSSENRWAEFDIAKKQSENYRYSLNNLTDGGDTEELAGDIAYSTPPDALSLHNDLMYKSPYLSDTIMVSAIGKDNVLPDAMIRDVLVQNPQSAKSGQVLNALDNRFEPLPEYMMAEIMDGQDIMGNKESMESKLGFWQLEENRIANSIAMDYLTDSTNTVPLDSLILLYQRVGYLDSRYKKAFIHVEKAEYSLATSELNAIEGATILSPAQVAAHGDYEQYASILNTMKLNGIAEEQLDSATVLSLKTIVQNEYPLVSAFARGLLIKGGFIEYTEKVAMPESTKSLRVYNHKKPGSNEVVPNGFMLFPNPSFNYVIAEYDLGETTKKGILTIHTTFGTTIQQIELLTSKNQVLIPMHNVTAGTYVVTLTIDGKKMAARKLEITR